MSTRWKERIIGTIVIVGLLVIWLPFFLKNDNQHLSQTPGKKELIQQLKEHNQPEVATRQEEPSVKDNLQVPVAQKEMPVSIDREIQEVAMNEEKQPAVVPDVVEPVIAKETLEKEKNKLQKVESQSEHHLIKKPDVVEQKENKTTEEIPTQSSKKVEKVGKSESAQWAVRVAQISTAQNAKILVSKLKQKGFAPYQQQTRLPSGNRVFTIWIGKAATKAEAEKLSARVKKVAGFSGTVAQMERG